MEAEEFGSDFSVYFEVLIRGPAYDENVCDFIPIKKAA
jgi:hypothetical protein